MEDSWTHGSITFPPCISLHYLFPISLHSLPLSLLPFFTSTYQHVTVCASHSFAFHPSLRQTLPFHFHHFLMSSFSSSFSSPPLLPSFLFSFYLFKIKHICHHIFHVILFCFIVVLLNLIVYGLFL